MNCEIRKTVGIYGKGQTLLTKVHLHVDIGLPCTIPHAYIAQNEHPSKIHECCIYAITLFFSLNFITCSHRSTGDLCIFMQIRAFKQTTGVTSFLMMKKFLYSKFFFH